MLRAKITVTLKESIFDPQGKATENTLKEMGFPVGTVRIGKFIEVSLVEKDKEKAEKIVQEISDQLLANPVIEDYSFELEG
ncbi:MAG: phosphoribosylformylglycinamidine synthase subunit PurS [Desulfitobacteriia bacterium]|jgi:phosphoribosylformylglycinamidine synthase PurS subunit